MVLVAAAAGVLCLLALLLHTQPAGLGSLADRLGRRGGALSTAALRSDEAAAAGSTAAAAAGGGSAPALPCLFNTLLHPDQVQWSTANGTADQLSVRGCSLKRYSAEEARRCLSGRRLVFVGDSVTRCAGGAGAFEGWAGRGALRR